ncbi:MAG: endolytic transglycosylase MltG [Lachnospiraceae bacterium]|nr:endolytic transglycosylase MltG [Lachnospiraceae bacterium]
MKIREVVFAALGTIAKVVVTILVVYYVYQGAMLAYDYGYRIFTEPAMTAEDEGWDVTVTVTKGNSTMEIAENLQGKGLIRDAKLFYLQNLLSEYKDTMKAGTYVLNTSMTAKEMMEIMSAGAEESTESEE